MSEHVVQAIRSLGIALYGVLFGLAAFTVWIAVRERRHGGKERLRKMWRAVIWIGLGIMAVAIYGGTRRWALLVLNEPFDFWRLFWTLSQTVLLIIGLTLALKVEAQVRHEDHEEGKHE